MTKQTFGSAVRHPWALALFGASSAPGKRPGTSMFYITDDEGTHWRGGYVEWYRAKGRLVRGADGYYRVGAEERERWHHRYQREKLIPKTDVLHIFPHTGKSNLDGPAFREIKAVRLTLPITPHEEAAA